MATLQEKLDTIRANFEAQAPTEALELMRRATRDLIDSGAADRALGAGARAPAFVLPDHTGAELDSTQALARGPMVLTFFRGHW